MRAILSALFAATLASAGAEAASEVDWASCEAFNVAACTRVLADGSESKANRAIALMLRATGFVGRGQNGLALADYNEVIRLDQGNGQPYVARGSVYGKIGQLKNAIADFNQAIRIDPKDVYAYFMRGFTHIEVGDTDQAIRDLQLAIAIPARDATGAALQNEARKLLAELERQDRAKPTASAPTMPEPEGPRGDTDGDQKLAPDAGGSSGETPTISPIVVLGLAAIALLLVVSITVRRDLSTGSKVFVALAAPIISGVLFYGLGLRDEITLAEFTILSLPFGGALVAALAFRAGS